MQDYTKTNRLSTKTFLFFAIVLFLAYLPISSFLFFLKNDAFNGYFPPKFFMSESIHAGYLPLWNPYINFGFPQFGDMSGGFWSPITWLIASTIGYNAYTLTIELMFYIFLSGIGMYQLMGVWVIKKNIRIIAGIAYMCCGYQIGHLQHFNWLSGSAFLPWCCWCYILLLRNPSAKNILINALLFYLLFASAHPGLSIGAFYFFTTLLIFYFSKIDSSTPLKARFKKTGRSHILFVTALLLLASGMIIGYADIIPHFSRGEKINIQDTLSGSTSIRSWISIFLPFATVKNTGYFNTDLSLRDSYFSLLLALFFIMAFIGSKTSWQKFFIVIGLLFAFLSAEGFIKTFAYKYIPLIGYVRLNGEFRIFALLAFIIVGAVELDKFFIQQKKFNGALKWLWYSITSIIFILTLWAILKSVLIKDGFMFQFQNISLQQGLTGKLKFLIDSISFYDTIWLQGIIQLVILWLIKLSLKEKNELLLKITLVADVVLASLLCIPFTGAGKASLAQVQTVLNKSPRGIPLPVLHPIYKNDTLSVNEKDLLGNWSMYNKQIGTMHEVPYPIQLKITKEYFAPENTINRIENLNKPFLYVMDKKENNTIRITSFSPNHISILINSDTISQLIIQQNFYPHWFYQNNGISAPVNKESTNFWSIPINKGVNNIQLTFKPTLVKNAMLFSLIILLLYITIFIALSVNNKSKV